MTEHSRNQGTVDPLTDIGSEKPKWFIPQLTTVNDGFRKLLEDRGIPPSRVLQHTTEVRDDVWQNVFPYPCLGEFVFTWNKLPTIDVFPEVVERMKSGSPKLLDFACGLGQDLRCLESAGIESKRLTGTDLKKDMIEGGYKLFQDKGTFQARFFVSDMLDVSTFPEDAFGSFDFISACCAFHFFGWDKQIEACQTICKLLKPVAGSLIFGYQTGRTESVADFGRHHIFVHDPKTFEEMWKIVGKEAGLSFDVKTSLVPMEAKSLSVADPDIRTMKYSVRVISNKQTQL